MGGAAWLGAVGVVAADCCETAGLKDPKEKTIMRVGTRKLFLKTHLSSIESRRASL